ncbi:MAG: hypothetical protein AAF611_13360 [Bacteroidota bacterium]
MNTFILSLVLFFSNSYGEFLHEEIALKKDPYAVKFQVEQVKGNLYNFIITMELAPKAHYVSPHSKGDYTGRFYIRMEKNSTLETTGKLLEHPAPEETIDRWSGNPISFVRENTTYQQQFRITNTNDFTIDGEIGFVIEPRCTREHVKFSIVKRNGIISVAQKK